MTYELSCKFKCVLLWIFTILWFVVNGTVIYYWNIVFPNSHEGFTIFWGVSWAIFTALITGFAIHYTDNNW